MLCIWTIVIYFFWFSNNSNTQCTVHTTHNKSFRRICQWMLILKKMQTTSFPCLNLWWTKICLCSINSKWILIIVFCFILPIQFTLFHLLIPPPISFGIRIRSYNQVASGLKWKIASVLSISRNEVYLQCKLNIEINACFLYMYIYISVTFVRFLLCYIVVLSISMLWFAKFSKRKHLSHLDAVILTANHSVFISRLHT